MERDALLIARAWKAAGYPTLLEGVLRDALEEEGDALVARAVESHEAWLDACDVPCQWNMVWHGVRYTCDDVYSVLNPEAWCGSCTTPRWTCSGT